MVLHKPDGLREKRKHGIFVTGDEKTSVNCTKFRGLFGGFILTSVIKASSFLAAWGRNMTNLAVLFQL